MTRVLTVNDTVAMHGVAVQFIAGEKTVQATRSKR